MPRSKPPEAATFHSVLTVETARGAFTGKRWMALLAALTDSTSITAAARSVGLSYKAAWDAIDAMNNLSDAPLVERTVGGRGGGGTRLTARGAQLVATWHEVAAENARFLQQLNARVADAGADLILIERLTMQTSARNQLAGHVERIIDGAVNDEIQLRLSGGGLIVATITRTSRAQLGLAEGSDALALVKASGVIVGLHDSTTPTMSLSARNQLPGTISRITPGAVNTEVVIALAGGNSLVAIVTNGSAKDMALADGVTVVAIFKASSVILAVRG